MELPGSKCYHCWQCAVGRGGRCGKGGTGQGRGRAGPIIPRALAPLYPILCVEPAVVKYAPAK